MRDAPIPPHCLKVGAFSVKLGNLNEKSGIIKNDFIQKKQIQKEKEEKSNHVSYIFSTTLFRSPSLHQ